MDEKSSENGISQNGTAREHGIERLRELTTETKFCMLTTRTVDGVLRSRPMTLQQAGEEGDLWFLTGEHTPLADEIEADPQVNVSFANSGQSHFVSVSGRAFLRDDPQKKKEMWNPLYKTWFPLGLEDPDLVLLKIEITSAEYWDSPGGPATYLFGMVKALATGKPPAYVGEREKLSLRP